MVIHDGITHNTEVPVVQPPFETIIVTTILLDEYEHDEAMATGIPYFYNSAHSTRPTQHEPNPPTFYA